MVLVAFVDQRATSEEGMISFALDFEGVFIGFLESILSRVLDP